MLNKARSFVLVSCVLLACCAAKKKSEYDHHDKMQGKTVEQVLDRAIELAENQMKAEHCLRAFARYRHKKDRKLPSKDFHRRITFTLSEFVQGSPFAYAAVNCFQPDNIMVSAYWTRINTSPAKLAVVLIHEYAHTLQCDEWKEETKDGMTKEKFNAMQELHEQEAEDVAVACVTEPIDPFPMFFEDIEDGKMPRYADGW